MGDHRQSLLRDQHSSEAEGRPDWEQDNDALGVQSTVSGSQATEDATYPDDEELRFEDQEEEILPEEVTGEELPGSPVPEEALAQLERVLEKDLEEGIPEMRWAPRSGACGWGRDTGWGESSSPTLAPVWPPVPLLLLGRTGGQPLTGF